jgi:hypothetical protein
VPGIDPPRLARPAGLELATLGFRCPRPRKRSSPRSRDEGNRCGRLWKTLCVFQAAVDGVLSVHGCGSVHAVVELRESVRVLHHLTGHYLYTSFQRASVMQEVVAGELDRCLHRVRREPVSNHPIQVAANWKRESSESPVNKVNGPDRIDHPAPAQPIRPRWKQSCTTRHRR